MEVTVWRSQHSGPLWDTKMCNHSQGRFTIEERQVAAQSGFQKSLLVYDMAEMWPGLCFVPRRSVPDSLLRSKHLDSKMWSISATRVTQDLRIYADNIQCCHIPGSSFFKYCFLNFQTNMIEVDDSIFPQLYKVSDILLSFPELFPKNRHKIEKNLITFAQCDLCRCLAEKQCLYLFYYSQQKYGCLKYGEGNVMILASQIQRMYIQQSWELIEQVRMNRRGFPVHL